MNNTPFYRTGMHPKDRVDIENLIAQLVAERQRSDELENALVELAELYAAQDDALVELAEMIAE